MDLSIYDNDKTTIVQDADDTKIQVEESADEDKIRFDIGGNERFVFEETNGSPQLKILNTSKKNIFIGDSNIGDNNTGSSNTVIGANTFPDNTSGTYNTGIGQLVLASNTTGNFNAAIGQATLLSNTTGEKNTAMGAASLLNNQTGNNNVGLGYNTGYFNNGSGSVFLGFEAGYNETGSNKLYIENSNADSTGALIYGEFDNNRLKVNGHLSITDGFADADNDTKIQVEESADEDKIRFDIGGHESMIVTKNANNNTQLVLDDSNVSSFFLGDITTGQSNTGDHNIGIGRKVLQDNLSGDNNIGIGHSALYPNTTGEGNVAISVGSLTSNTTGSRNIGIGLTALLQNTTGNDNIALGHLTGFVNTTGSQNVFIGSSAGKGAGVAGNPKNNNVMIGFEAGYDNNSDANIFLGYQAGYSETGSNKLYIENSNSTSPLLYGEFDNDLLRINGTLNINNAFSFPTADGTNGQVLQTDGNGSLTWTTPTDNDNQTLSLATNTLSLTNGGSVDLSIYDNDKTTIVQDADNDTKIQVEESSDEDIIRFDLSGQEALNLNKTTGGKARMTFSNNNSNIYLGDNNTAENDNGSNNVALGSWALYSSNSSNDNIGIGTFAGANNQNGDKNIFIGTEAGGGSFPLTPHNKSNSVMIGYGAGAYNTGSNNVFLGYEAGKNESGSNKLIIDNSNTIEPLIYGEFDNNLLRIYGTLNIKNEYSFPTVDGTANQVLQTDGSGTISWSDKGNFSNNIQLNGNYLSNDGDNEGITIDNSGNVTISSGVDLGIAEIGNTRIGSILASGSNWAGFSHKNFTNTYAFLHNNTGNTYINAEAGQTVHFRIANADMMYLSSNGHFGIGRVAATNILEVNGQASKTSAGSWVANSDQRLKKNITPLSSEKMLNDLLALQGVTYEWNDNKTGNDRPEGIQYGFTAQNIQTIFPTLVEEDAQGYLQTAYGTYDAMTVEAIRALNNKIESQSNKITALEKENAALQAQAAKIQELEKMFSQLQEQINEQNMSSSSDK